MSDNKPATRSAEEMTDAEYVIGMLPISYYPLVSPQITAHIDRIKKIAKRLEQQDAIASQRAESQAVPDGCQLVPKEPTTVMDNEGSNAVENEINQEGCRKIYKAMLAAAPPPPTVSAWQPIETAPKDGTHILIKNPRMDNPVIGKFGNYYPEHSHKKYQEWVVVIDHLEKFMPLTPGSLICPTHWMPHQS